MYDQTSPMTAVRKPAIGTQMERLVSAVNLLPKLIDELQNRLGPVTLHEPGVPMAANADTPERLPGCDLAQSIAVEADAVHSATNRIQRIIASLDI